MQGKVVRERVYVCAVVCLSHGPGCVMWFFLCVVRQKRGCYCCFVKTDVAFFLLSTSLP